jgi:hypothetical protein
VPVQAVVADSGVPVQGQPLLILECPSKLLLLILECLSKLLLLILECPSKGSRC